MTWRVVLSTPAQEDLRNLPPELLPIAIDELRRLGANPVTLSRRSVTPPYPPGYQMFEFLRVLDGRRHTVVVLFRYRTNETELFVHAVGHRRQTVND